jgi:hypothetical protein
VFGNTGQVAALPGGGVPLTQTSTGADEIVERARETAQLDDFGSDSFREGLEILLRAVGEEIVPNPEIKERVFALATEFLVNRLRLTDYVRRHPEVAQAEVPGPLVVLGLPRRGTTVVSYLLDQDPRRRSLLLWEALDSVPPPTTATLRTDPRCVARKAEQIADLERSPHVRPHFEWADGPTECIRLHSQDFKGLLWEAFLPIPEYSRWIMTADLTSAYEYERAALQVLQSQAPGTWSLKMPSHSLHIEWLVKVFPDARLVWTHRDPYRALGSLFSMKSNNWKRSCGTPALEWLREHYPRQLSEHVNRPLRHRERIYDLHYADVMRDPIAEMRELYAWTGDEYTPEAEAAMRAWLVANPQDSFGRHEYVLDQFGLSVRDLEPYFADYLAAVDVEREGA